MQLEIEEEESCKESEAEGREGLEKGEKEGLFTNKRGKKEEEREEEGQKGGLKDGKGKSEQGKVWKRIKGIPNMYEIKGDRKICGLASYKRGEVYGIDLSSAAVVIALDPKPSDYVLDLCCSPGAKLCFIADLLKSYSPPDPSSFALSNQPIPFSHPTLASSSSFLPSAGLVGVDINENRLNICRNLLKRYDHSDVELFLDDGVFFNKRSKFDKVLVDAECTHDGSIKHFKKFWKVEEGERELEEEIKDKTRGEEIEEEERGKGEENEEKTFENARKITKNICKKDVIKQKEEERQMNEEGRKRTISKKEDEEMKKQETESKQSKIKLISNKERKRRLKQKMISNKNPYLSEKKGKNEWKMRDFEERFLDPKKLNEITSLQLKLLKNGYNLTKKGGILVYSTCTFSRKQNEDVILEFIEEVEKIKEKEIEGESIIEKTTGKIEILDVFDKEMMENLGCYEGFLPKTVRFDPIKSKCGGMFICKIRKLVD